MAKIVQSPPLMTPGTVGGLSTSKPLNPKIQLFSRQQYLDASTGGGTSRPTQGQVWPRGNQ